MTEVSIFTIVPSFPHTHPNFQSDLAAMLQRKRHLQGDSGKPQAANWATLERARLTQERTLAIRRNDKEEVRHLDAQLAILALECPPAPTDSTEDASVLLAKVNERNRKANLEAIRRAELQEAERKRRERRLGTPTALDPSARLRTVPRLFASRYVVRCLPSVENFDFDELTYHAKVCHAKPWGVTGARVTLTAL